MADELVTVDPDILGGTPVFRGTRVPVKSLFEYLEDNYTLEQVHRFLPERDARYGPAAPRAF